MKDNPGSSDNFRYAGFISYSQKDKHWAKRIHRALEAYRLPTGIQPDPEKKNRLGRFFRDDDELAGVPSLGDALESSLNSSAALIVICSPNSARSKWVDAEIRKFKSRGPSAKVLAVMVDGKPDSDDPEIMCFAPSLLVKVNKDGELTNEPDEPLAPDANKEPFDRLIVRLVAGLLGIEFDTLWQREQRRIRKRRLQIGIAAAFSAIGIGTGFMMYLESERQREFADQEQFIAESKILARSSQAAMDEHNLDDALSYALAALPKDLSKPSRPITPEANAALQRVMNATHALKVVARYEQNLENLRLLSDGRLVVWLENKQVHVINADTGSIDWKSEAGTELKPLGESDLVASITSESYKDDQGYYQLSRKATVRDLKTGKVLRQLESGDRSWGTPYILPELTPVSNAGSHMLLIKSVDNKPMLGVQRIPIFGEIPTAPIIYQTILPGIAYGDYYEAVFADDSTVVISIGGDRKSIALWHLTDNKLQMLAKHDSPLTCNQTESVIWDTRDDQITLSDNGQIITRARPVSEDSWCVEFWSVKNGELMTEHLISGYYQFDSLDAISAEQLILSEHDSYSSGSMWSKNKEPISFRNCRAPRTNVLAPLKVDDTEWLIKPAIDFSACINKSKIQTYSGKHFSTQKMLYGHNKRVRALAIDTKKSRLYSAGDDGQIRAWMIDITKNKPVPEINVINIASSSERAALLYGEPDTGYSARVYNSNRTQASPVIPLELKTSDLRGYDLIRTLKLMNNENTLATIEYTYCNLNCPSDLPRQITFYRNSDGEMLAQIDNLIPGRATSTLPMAYAQSVDDKRIALPRRDGNVIEIDTATGSVIKTHSIEGWMVEDVAYSFDHLLILTNDGGEFSSDRKMRLIRVDPNGRTTIIWEKRAMKGRFHSAPSTQKTLIEVLELNDELLLAYELVNADGTINEIVIPASHQSSNAQLQSATYYNNESSLVMLFDRTGVTPLTIDLSNGVDKITAESLSFHKSGYSSLPFFMSDHKRVFDPLNRVIASVDDINNKLFFLNLPGQTALCPDFVDHSASAAAFSLDGLLLAIADTSNKLTVYDVQTCAIIHSEDLAVDSLSKQLRFIDSNSLWAVTTEGHVKIINFAEEPDTFPEQVPLSMHERAIKLSRRLGLVSTANQLH